VPSRSTAAATTPVDVHVPEALVAKFAAGAIAEAWVGGEAVLPTDVVALGKGDDFGRQEACFVRLLDVEEAAFRVLG